jgi:SSS family solute:Na+ symporter
MVRWPDVLIIGAYLSGLVGMGLYFSRRQTSTEQYFVARRSIPGWAMGMSLLATIITSITFIAYPGSAYADNWSLIVPGFMFVVVLAIAGKVLVPFFRQSVRMSAYEYFGKRFGRSIRLYSSFAFVLGHFSKMGFVFYLLSLTVSSMTGWKIGNVLAVAGVVTIFYTLIGGMEAVIWTDVLQGFVLWTGICVCIGFLLFLPPGGPHAVLSVAWQNHKFSLGSMELRLDQPTILVLVIYGFFFYLQKYTADQTVVQRYLVAPTDRSALRGITLGAALCIPVWGAFMLIGSLLWAYYRLTGERLPPSINKPDQVFPHFLVTHLPVGFAGLFVACLFGSAMSMLASDMNALAVIGVEDYYVLLRPQSSDKSRLRMGRWLVVVSGLGAAGAGWGLVHSHGSALSLYFAVTASVAGGLAGLFLLAFLCPRACRGAAQAGVAASLLVTAWGLLTSGSVKIAELGRWDFPWHEYMVGAVGNIVLFCVGLLISLLAPGPHLTDPRLTLWGWMRKSSEDRILNIVAQEHISTHGTGSEEMVCID